MPTKQRAPSPARSLLTNSWLAASCFAILVAFLCHNNKELNEFLVGYVFTSYTCMFAFAFWGIKNHAKTTSGNLFSSAMAALYTTGALLVITTKNTDYFWSITIWWWIAGIIFVAQRNLKNNNLPLDQLRKSHKIILGIVAAVTVVAATAPMGTAEFWRSTPKLHTTKDGDRMIFSVPAYELLGDALLNKRLYVDLPVDPKLLKTDYPYNYKKRIEVGASYFTDFVFYNSKYYVYFGVVPAILLFTPYQWITGLPLATFRATQVFGTFSIIGIFTLFFLLAKTFFRKTPFSLYLVCSTIFSLVGISFAISHGNHYSTAVISGVCFEVWSLYFLVRAGWHEKNDRSRVLQLFLGSLCGALTFGCRPPIGMANIVLVPVLMRMRTFWPNLSPQNIARYGIALSPHLVVAATLMTYNFARFGNPFDFGINYTMGIDVMSYHFDFTHSVNLVMHYLVGCPWLKSEYHDVDKFSLYGIIKYPVLLFFIFLFNHTVQKQLALQQCKNLTYMLFIAAFIVMFLDVLAAPWWGHERNRMDFYFLLCIVSFIALCSRYEVASDATKASLPQMFLYAALFTLAAMALLLTTPFELNYAATHKNFNNYLLNILLFRNS